MTLYVVATPIGNLADLSSRARQVLASVSLIAAEDTRHSKVLLAHHDISTPMKAYHDFSDSRAAGQILGHLHRGESVALISDAGTPLISDPGYKLVQEAISAGFDVVPVPGPSAVIAALSVSGLPTDRFSFEGFLPAKAAARRQKLAAVEHDERTLVWYESPRRVAATLKDIAEVLGDERPMAIARELTKTFEQVSRGTVQALQQQVADGTVPCKGEFVLMLGGAEASGFEIEADRLLKVLLAELPPARAALVASQLLEQPRKALYQLAMQMKAKTD